MTKKQQAQQLVIDNPSLSRNEIIEMFMSKLNMTKAGATTYYSMCGSSKPVTAKPKPTPNVTNVKPNTSTTETKGDSRPLYTVCTIVNDVVDYTSSWYDKQDAFNECKGNQVVVKGLPELNSHISTLKCIEA